MGTVRESVELEAEAATVFRFVTNPEHFVDYVAGYREGRVTFER